MKTSVAKTTPLAVTGVGVRTVVLASVNDRLFTVVGPDDEKTFSHTNKAAATRIFVVRSRQLLGHLPTPPT